MNEVVAVEGGWRLKVVVPPSKRAKVIPPTYTLPLDAIRALDLWNMEVEGQEPVECEHMIARHTCGYCLGMVEVPVWSKPSEHEGTQADTTVPWTRTDAQGLGPPVRDREYPGEVAEGAVVAAHVAATEHFTKAGHLIPDAYRWALIYANVCLVSRQVNRHQAKKEFDAFEALHEDDIVGIHPHWKRLPVRWRAEPTG